MAGKIREKIDSVFAQRAMGNPMLEKIIKTKMILKGINPAKYTLQSDDDPGVLEKIESMLMELGNAASDPKTSSNGGMDVSTIIRAPKMSGKTDIITACSAKDTIEEIVKDINEQFGFFDIKLLLFFSSSKYAPDE